MPSSDPQAVARSNARLPAPRRTPEPRRLRIGMVALGLVSLLSFLGLFRLLGFRASMGGNFLDLAWQEAFFWVAHGSLATPGLLLMGWGLSPWLSRPLGRGLDALVQLSTSRWRLAAAGYTALLFLLALAGNQLVLDGLPHTDDELTIEYGARMIAAGQLTAEEPPRVEDYHLPFVYTRDGRIASFDFPGGLFVAAFAWRFGLGPLPYALLAALGGLAALAGIQHWTGRQGALLGAGLWLASPMLSTLSFTTHPHLLSRSLLGFVVLAWSRLDSRSAISQRALLGWGALLGTSAGLAFLMRPAETSFLLLPLAIHLVARASEDPRLRPAIGAATALTVVFLFTFSLYNHALTGSWLSMPRLETSAPLANALPLPELLGVNTGFNWMMIAIFFLGPGGVLLALPGLRRPVGVIAGLGVLATLLLASAHSETGIHSVGPIHYSEASLFLLLLVVLGARSVVRSLEHHGVSRDTQTVLVLALGVSLLLFQFVHAHSLVDQARNQRVLLEGAAGLDQAIVLSPWAPDLWETRPDLGAVGSWVMHPPRPDPWLRDPVLWMQPETDLETLRREFPDRAIYRLTFHADGDPVRRTLVAPPSALDSTAVDGGSAWESNPPPVP